MKKFLRNLFVCLLICNTSIAEIIELNKCFKSAGYGWGNERKKTIGKSWDTWLTKYIYVGDFAKCDFDSSDDGTLGEDPEYSVRDCWRTTRDRTRINEKYQDGTLVDPKDWKKINILEDHIFSIDSLKLILLSAVLAIPLAWYLLDKWLSGFPYRVEIGLSVFVQSALAVMIVAMMTIGVRIVQAAFKNPADNLRTE